MLRAVITPPMLTLTAQVSPATGAALTALKETRAVMVSTTALSAPPAGARVTPSVGTATEPLMMVSTVPPACAVNEVPLARAPARRATSVTMLSPAAATTLRAVITPPISTLTVQVSPACGASSTAPNPTATRWPMRTSIAGTRSSPSASVPRTTSIAPAGRCLGATVPAAVKLAPWRLVMINLTPSVIAVKPPPASSLITTASAAAICARVCVCGTPALSIATTAWP